MSPLRWLLSLAAAMAAACLPLAAALRLPERPNIVVIVADDHGWADVGFNETSRDLVTPHLDRLAASGIRFTNGYATSPICTPSRIGLTLGAYQQRWGNWWYGGPGLPGSEVPTIAEILRSAGYATGMIGKIHYSGEFNAQVRNHPLNHGFDLFFGFNGPAQHYLVRSAERERVFLEKVRKHQPQNLNYPLMFYAPMWVNRERRDIDGFSTHLFRDRAVSFIREHTDRPFFLQVSFNAVHDSTYQLPPDWLRAQGIEPVADWDPAIESSGSWARRAFPSREVKRTYIAGHVHFLDQAVGAIVEALEATSQREETLIIYTSDNGAATTTEGRSEPLRSGKYTLFEGGTRVHYLASWPGVVKPGQVLDNLVSAMDVLPTAAALAGRPIPPTTDGINLVPLLTGEDPKLAHPVLFWDAGHRWAVRQGSWKLHFGTRSHRGANHDEGLGFYLRDLGQDLGEQRNLILDHPEKAAELGQLHREWLERVLRGQPVR